MRTCCVPGCAQKEFERGIRIPLHSVPYTNELNWKHWLNLCPFLIKYSHRQLEYVKICRKHFIPEHINFEKGRLRKGSFPILNLPGLESSREVNKSNKILEINPIQLNESVTFKVVGPQSSPEKTPNDCAIFHLKPGDSHSLPVDHNMYCLPSRLEVNSQCQPKVNEGLTDTLSILKEEYNTKDERSLDDGSSCVISVASLTDPKISSQHTDEVPAIPSAHIEYTLREQLEDRTFSEDSHCDTMFDDDGTQVKLYFLPSNTVLTGVDKSTHEHTHSKKQSSLYSSRNYLRFEACEPKHALNTNKQYMLPSSGVPPEFSPCNHHAQDTTHESSSDNACLLSRNIQIYPKVPVNVVQPKQSRSVQTMTLESLVAELWEPESTSAEDTANLPTSSAMFVADPPDCLLNSTSDAAPQPLKRDSQLSALQYSALSNTKIKRVRFDKENSTPYEHWLRFENKLLKKKVKAINSRLKNTKLKLDRILAIAKPFVLAYPHLTCKTKALIDTQLRLAGATKAKTRYNEEDKLFALKLHQISPDCYRFLQTYLKLPKKSTMQIIKKNA